MCQVCALYCRGERRWAFAEMSREVTTGVTRACARFERLVVNGGASQVSLTGYATLRMRYGSWLRCGARLVGVEAVLVCSSGRPEDRRSQVVWDEGPSGQDNQREVLGIGICTRANGPGEKRKTATKNQGAVQCRSETESGCAWRSYFWPRALV